MIGIYKITNIKNGKFYIGSSINLELRHRQHILGLRANRHSCIRLQNSFNKYGEESFKYEVIEELDSEDQIRDREQYYLDLTKCYDPKIGYNVQKKSKVDYVKRDASYRDIVVLSIGKEIIGRFSDMKTTSKALGLTRERIRQILHGRKYNKTIEAYLVFGNQYDGLEEVQIVSTYKTIIPEKFAPNMSKKKRMQLLYREMVSRNSKD